MRLGLGLGLGRWQRVPAPKVLSLTAAAACVWPDYVSVAATVANADSVRFALDGYTTQTVTAAQAAAGIRLLSDGTPPIAGWGSDALLSATPLRNTQEGVAHTTPIAVWPWLDGWFGHSGVVHAAGEINSWGGQGLGLLHTAATNLPNLLAPGSGFSDYTVQTAPGSLERFTSNSLLPYINGASAFAFLFIGSFEETVASNVFNFSNSDATSRLAAYRHSTISDRLIFNVRVAGTSNYVVATVLDGLPHAYLFRYAGADAPPRLRVYCDGELRSGAELGGAVPPTLPANMTLGGLPDISGTVIETRYAAMLATNSNRPIADLLLCASTLRARYLT
ncbi:MAG: hypothetical protein WC683_06390 [bacterium]